MQSSYDEAGTQVRIVAQEALPLGNPAPQGTYLGALRWPHRHRTRDAEEGELAPSQHHKVCTSQETKEAQNGLLKGEDHRRSHR